VTSQVILTQGLILAAGPTGLWLQPDGNLVLYRAPSTTALWATGTSGNGVSLGVNDNGFVSIYDSTRTNVLWSYDTSTACGTSAYAQHTQLNLDATYGDLTWTVTCSDGQAHSAFWYRHRIYTDSGTWHGVANPYMTNAGSYSRHDWISNPDCSVGKVFASATQPGWSGLYWYPPAPGSSNSVILTSSSDYQLALKADCNLVVLDAQGNQKWGTGALFGQNFCRLHLTSVQMNTLNVEHDQAMLSLEDANGKALWSASAGSLTVACSAEYVSLLFGTMGTVSLQLTCDGDTNFGDLNIYAGAVLGVDCNDLCLTTLPFTATTPPTN